MPDVSTEQLSAAIEQLSALNSEYLAGAQRFMHAGKGLFTLDLMAMAVTNRALSLSAAYATLAQSENYLAAASLIRLQLDNALRFFASTLVTDTTAFAWHYLNGKEIRDYTDGQGNKLTDNFLARQLDTLFPGVYQLYREACGYVHLSDRHLLPTIAHPEDTSENTTEKGMRFAMQISTTGGFSLEDKIEFSTTMLEVSKLVLIVIEQWKHEKDRLAVAGS